MAPSPRRRLADLFIRQYLHPDTGPVAGDRQQSLATAIALLVSPGLFVTVIMAAKYVLTPFPNPGETAVWSLFDHLLFFSMSWVVLALVAVFQWDRLALDARDASILGLLPIPTRHVVHAKWMATAWMALVASVVFNALPALIYPLLSVSRLEIPGLLVLWLAVWHFLVGVSAGLIGFLAILGVREVLWAAAGPRRFGAISAGVQAVLVVVLVMAVFLLPPVAGTAVRNAHPAARWLPPVGFAAVFEAGAGRLIVDLPPAPMPQPLEQRARRAADVYRAHARSLQGVAGATMTACAMLAALTVVLVAWNGRRLPPHVPAGGTRRSAAARVGRVARRWLVRRPAVQAGAFLTLRTLTRSQPHRLALAIALAMGLAAGAVGLVGQPRPGPSLRDVPVALLAVQHLLMMSLAAGLRVAIRSAADARASWVFALAWDTDRRRYVSGVVVAGGVLLGTVVLLLVPVHAWFLHAGAVARHAVCGAILGLVLVELVALAEPSVPLTTSVPPSESARAWVALGIPIAIVVATVVAALERVSPEATVAGLAALWCLLHLLRRARHAERRPWRLPVEDERHGLELSR